jgi:hypothetical protein
VESIIIDGISVTMRSIVAEMPGSAKQVVRIFSDRQVVTQIDLSEARILRDWLKAQLVAGVGLKITAGMLSADTLSRVCETSVGWMRLQFSPNAANDYVAQTANW